MAWLAGWDNRIKLTIDCTKVDSSQSWFPITVFLDPTHGDCVFDELTADANRLKIAFTKADGTTELYAEIERWDDANELAVIHVSRDGWAISDSVDTDFYMYYDVDHADNTSYIGDTGDAVAQNVWDSDFKAVYHMSQDPSAGGFCILDSTSNSNDGSPNGSMTSGDLVDGKVGKGLDFDGGDDYIGCGSDTSLDDLVNKTIEVVIKLASWGEAQSGRIIQKSYGNADGWGLLVSGSTNMFMQYIQDWDNGTLANWNSPTSSLSLSTDYYLAASYNKSATGNDPLLYIDGASEIVTEGTPPTGSVDSDAVNSMWIGARNNVGSPDRTFEGVQSEVRISGSIRSADWIKATYNSLWNTLLTYSSEEILTTVAPTTLAPTTLAPTTPSPTTLPPTTLAPTTLAPTSLPPTTVAPTTLAPTTLAPTSLPPTTLAPTTLAPTSLAPTTLAPTSLPPTTLAPTTLLPTTLPPTTIAPTTLAPTTAAVTTLAPTTAAPTTVVVTTVAPTTSAPTSLAPTTTAPTSLAPTTIGPTTIVPTSLAPTTAEPTTLPPTTTTPTTLPPTTLEPTTSAPTTIGPTTLAPSTLSPTSLAPTTNIPEEICVRECDSTIIQEIICMQFINTNISCYTPITEEILCHGNLCQ